MKLLTTIETVLKSFPIIARPILAIYHRYSVFRFRSSAEYWIERYKKGGNSGYGSYGQLATFKAKIINDFVEKNSIKTVIEYGCGDGNQLKLARYPSYIGFDISPDAVELCRGIFKNDETKTFYLSQEYDGQKADLTLSLDVIYHLVEDEIFEKYMRLLFESAKEYTIIYSTNYAEKYKKGSHIKHRRFTEWVKLHFPEWELLSIIQNEFSSVNHSIEHSKADFFFFHRTDNA